MKPRAVASLALVFALTILAACSPHEGGSCMAGTAACAGGNAMLSCLEGRFVRLVCRGAQGCASADGRVRCDQSVAQVHDRCQASAASGAACTPDHANMLRCNGTEMLMVTDCEGPRHCYNVPNATLAGTSRILCDESVVSVGDPCEGNDSACSVDHNSFMECADRHWRIRTNCAGPGHCSVDGNTVRCDESVMAAGAACSAENGSACVPDGSAFVICRHGTMTLGGVCSGARHCFDENHQIMCDGPVLASVGAACIGGSACSTDATHVLTCDNGTFAHATACAAGQRCQEIAGHAACAREHDAHR